ncbi:hypothetical protein LCGC14_1115300 [marine sediment metagenome]|uniref:Bacillithiol system redox-active protein YtxJ n=2 Tax=root TaxID=1 RepID=A0A831VMY9_9FLAO|nr:bacillithiol system redox-active protein YtxJ [Pricia sp.]HEA21180.1 bacillithiol system redox-active protein YtxJ [Pricia antarctica]
MGFFNSIFGSNNSEERQTVEKSPWIGLTSIDQLEEIEKNSTARTQVVFKHSTTCGVSRMVLNGFQKNPIFKENTIDYYFLDIHRHPDVSNEIARKFQVVHQSPQLLVIKNGETVAHDSHGSINALTLEKYV